MPSTIDKLTAVALRNLKPGRHWDGAGLYLEVTASGGRYWRFKYRFAGKEKRLAFGVFPEVSAAGARKRRKDARDLLARGIDPAAQRKLNRAERERVRNGTVTATCAAWLTNKRARWAPETARKAEYITDNYLLPKLGALPVATLSSRDCKRVLSEITERAPSLARKARQFLQGIVKQAIQDGLREDGRLLVFTDDRGNHAAGHIPAATLPDDMAAVLRAVDTYPVPVTRAALLLCAYTAQRPGVVAAMRWDELNAEGTEWRIPAVKMKMRKTHIVPLPKQARALVDAMRAYSAGREYVFPPLARQRTPHLHRDALSGALRRMGFAGRHATHGFRSMLRTAGRERLGIDADVLEAQLAHAKRDAIQAAYDRTTFTQERVRAMTRWADYLDNLRDGANVTPLRRTAR